MWHKRPRTQHAQTRNLRVLIEAKKEKKPEPENPANPEGFRDDTHNPNIPWETISPEDYELSRGPDGLTLVEWKNKNTQYLDMSRDPQLRQVTKISGRFYGRTDIPSSVTSIGDKTHLCTCAFGGGIQEELSLLLSRKN